MHDLLSDLRLAVRTCLKQPLPTLVIILSLGLGIGGTTAIYSFGRALLFTGDPLPDVVRVYSAGTDDAYGDTSAPDYLDVQAEVDAFESTALFRLGGAELRDGDSQRRLLVELVADDYFGITRLTPSLGRLPGPSETALHGAEPVVVLSHDLWRSQFGSDPDIEGRVLRIDGRPFTVVGVGPEGYSSRLMGLRIDAWLPLGVDGGFYNVGAGGLADRSEREYRVLGRLYEGDSPAHARAQLALLADRLRGEHPEAWTDSEGTAGRFTVLADDGSRVPPQGRAPLAVILGLVGVACGLVLLIACSNAAGLALARGQRRRREMAVRLSVGASRTRLVRMLLVESAIPALAAAAIGVAVSRLLTGLLRAPTLPIDVPLGWQVAQDGKVLLFALAVGFVATLLFGLAPALEGARTDLVVSLKGDAEGGSGRGMTLRRVLIVGQVALAVIFVVTSLVMWRGAGRLDTPDLGFDVDRLALMSRGLTKGELAGDGKQAALETLRDRLLARPEIDAVEFASSAESTFLSEEGERKVEVGDRESEPVTSNAVTETYFETFGISLVRGTAFDEHPGRRDIAVVNQAFARRFAAELGPDVLGRRFRLYDPRSGRADLRGVEIVGVAADGAYIDAADLDRPYVWTPFDADAQPWAIVTVRGSESAETALQALREVSPLSEGELSLVAPRTYQSMVEAKGAAVTAASRWVGGIGALGLLLALMGIYGLVSYIVGLRRRELAIRQALGATPRRLVLGVAGGGMRLAAVGFAVGLGPALLLAWALGDIAPGTRPFDVVALLTSALIVAAATLWASAWPARRIATGVPGQGVSDR